MNNLNQIEIQNIRHICGHSASFCDKLDYFKTLTEDQNIIQVYIQKAEKGDNWF